MWYLLYNITLTIGFLAALPFVPLIYLLGPRYRDGLGQRFGIYPQTVDAGLRAARPVWIHAASVGEVRAAAPLVRALKTGAPARKILLSTFTATGHRIAAQTEAVDPALLVFIETEIWPNLLRESFRRGIPTLLLSGRLSAKAFSRYARWRPFFRRVLGCFTFFGMQSSEDAARLKDLGADEKKISVVGSLKFAAGGVDDRFQSLISTHAPNGYLFVAGSTHRGEEEILLEVFAAVRARFPMLSMVIAPRHPERFAEVEKLLRGSPFGFHRKCQVQPDRYFEKDILLLDTVGELLDFFAAADIAFVGGSLVDAGGHNVLEPARLQKPVLFGPHMSNFERIAGEMKQRGGAVEVHGAADMADVLIDLLTDSEARLRMGKLASQFAGAHHEAFTRNLVLAQRYL